MQAIVLSLFQRAAKCKEVTHQFSLMKGVSAIVGEVKVDQVGHVCCSSSESHLPDVWFVLCQRWQTLAVLKPIMQPLAQHLANAVAKPKSPAAKAQLLQGLDMIGGCFASLTGLNTSKTPSLVGRNHPTVQCFGVLWGVFRQILTNYSDDADVVEKQCRYAVFLSDQPFS